ncbi:MAG: stage II sporulation protein E [Bacillota bacterium]|nr:stage II sporulation protein E [Bacillota bacterium]
MQYGVEVLSYKRDRKVENKKKSINYRGYVKLLAYFSSALLISRVILINNSAPFGIAFIMAVVLNKEDKMSIAAGCGTLLGYITIFNNIDNLPVYIMCTGTLVSGSYFIRSFSKRKKLTISFTAILLVNICYNSLIRNYSIPANLFSAFVEIVCIIPIYYMIQYAIACTKEIRTKHFFSSEEIISMIMAAALIISGTWGLAPWGISVRNIIAFVFVIMCAYINGSSTGAAAGVAVGLIVGMNTEDIVAYISGFGLCGLTVGLFKDTGKWLSALSCLVSFFILKMYSDIGSDFKFIEILFSSGILLAVPDRWYDSLALEFNWEKKAIEINERYTETIKDMFIDRLKGFSDILFNMSDAIKNLVNNDRLLLKNKSSALVENLADRVCSNCSMNTICWKREIYYTYTAFSEALQNFHENRNKLPEELERKCLRKVALIKNAEDIIENFITKETWRNRMAEGRQLAALHLNNMGQTVKEIVDDFNASIDFDNEIERYIKRILGRKGIDYSNIFCYKDKSQRINIKMTVLGRSEKEFCIKEILPVINLAVERSMCISEYACDSNSKKESCTMEFEEMPKYNVTSSVIRECKNGEVYNGDSCSYRKLKDGTYMIVISDGMGSGPEAGQESKAAVELIERFSEAGFSRETAVNTVNSIMAMKFSEEEKFSTLDISSIDLYTGDMNIMKVGAVATYIKKNDRVETVKSKTLPIGILDRVDIDIIDKKVKDGDIIVMLSDGVLECEGNNDSMELWIHDYLQECGSAGTKEIADVIVKRAKELNNGKAKDDITVIVSKVYSLY